MPADSLKTQGKIAPPRFFGVTMLEMVIAVSLLAGLSSFSFEWLAVETRLRQAETAARKLSGLATLVYRYAENPPPLTDGTSRNLENDFLNHIYVDNGLSSVDDQVPGNSLMNDRWPAPLVGTDWTDAFSAELRKSLPVAVRDTVHLPGEEDEEDTTGEATAADDRLKVLDSGDFGFENLEKTSGLARISLRNIPLEKAPIAWRTAALLRQQGFPTTYEIVEDPDDTKPNTLTLTLHLLPLERVLSPYIVGTDRVADIDAEYKVDLVVGGLSTRDAMAHTAFIQTSQVPFDFTIKRTDRATDKALRYTTQNQDAAWDTDASRPLQEGMRRLGGYSGFFNTCVKAWGSAYTPYRSNVRIKFVDTENPANSKREEEFGAPYQKGTGVQDCALQNIKRYEESEIRENTDGSQVLDLFLLRYSTNRYSLPGSSLYSWFNPTGISLFKQSGSWIPEKRNAFDNQLGWGNQQPDFMDYNPFYTHFRGPTVVGTGSAKWLSTPVVLDHIIGFPYDFQDYHFNEAASFAANTVIASANFPGVPSPKMGRQLQSKADSVGGWRASFLGSKPDVYSPERMAWMREDPFLYPPIFSVSWRPFNFHINASKDEKGKISYFSYEPEDEQGQKSYCRIDEMLSLSYTHTPRNETETYTTTVVVTDEDPEVVTDEDAEVVTDEDTEVVTDEDTEKEEEITVTVKDIDILVSDPTSLGTDFLNVPELLRDEHGKFEKDADGELIPVCKHSIWRAPQIEVPLPANRRVFFSPDPDAENPPDAKPAFEDITVIPAPVFGVVVRGTRDWHQKNPDRGVFFPNEFIHSPGLLPLRPENVDKLALDFRREIGVVVDSYDANEASKLPLHSRLDYKHFNLDYEKGINPNRQTIQIDSDDYGHRYKFRTALTKAQDLVAKYRDNPTTLNECTGLSTDGGTGSNCDPYRRVAAMHAISRETTPVAMLEETYTKNGKEINILQEAREDDLSYQWWHEKLETLAAPADAYSVGGCSKPGSIRYINNEFSLQCMRQVWRLYWIATKKAENQKLSSPVPDYDPKPTFDDLPFHLKDFLRYVAFRIYGGAPFIGAFTKKAFDWDGFASEFAKDPPTDGSAKPPTDPTFLAAKRFFERQKSDGSSVDFKSASGYPAWDAAPSWINADMASYRTWSRHDRYDGELQSLRLRSTCLNSKPVLGTIWHWPTFRYHTSAVAKRRTKMPFWYNNEKDYDYPVGSSLCADTLPGFPLTMHEGIYFLDGMHVYGKMYKRSDRRLKRNLRPLQVPEGGGMTSPRRTLLERHYPDLLSGDGRVGSGVDADGMVAALWQEVRTLVRQQQEELNTLEKEVNELLCRRLPDRCSVGQEPPG